MGGRGRGRGRGSIPFRRTGYSSDDILPPLNQPPPLYPPLQFKPLPLLAGKEYEYCVAMQQQFRRTFRESGYYIQPESKKKDIDRYTDKYRQINAADPIVWDERLFPKELFEKPRKKKKKVAEVKKKEAAAEIAEKLEVLEAKEQDDDAEQEDEQEEEGEEGMEEENEEELEEENDYARSYFDNGESYLDEEDDNADEGYE